MSTRPDFRGDYMGFTYNGTHSSDLGIVRTSDGSRFNENLLPTMQDKTVQIPGGDGTYYFGSYYTQKPFSIPFAFDGLTEEEFQNLKCHFGDKKVHDLIFDEKPDKIYRAKVTGTATIKHIPFDEDGTTVYKGEGTIQFTCYEPFARAATPSIGGVNNGDRPAPFKIVLSGNDSVKRIFVAEREINWEKLPSGVQAELDTKIGVAKITGSNNASYKIGDLANKYITGDLTAKIPVGATAPSNAIFTRLYY